MNKEERARRHAEAKRSKFMQSMQLPRRERELRAVKELEEYVERLKVRTKDATWKILTIYTNTTYNVRAGAHNAIRSDGGWIRAYLQSETESRRMWYARHYRWEKAD